MRHPPDPNNVSITFSENSYHIYMMQAVASADPGYEGEVHGEVITDFASAALCLQTWADRFLALAEVEGEG